MQKLNNGRYLPKFILLFLAKVSAYGLMLRNMMDQYLPFNNTDSTAIYRALNELGKSDAVESYWDTKVVITRQTIVVF